MNDLPVVVKAQPFYISAYEEFEKETDEPNDYTVAKWKDLVRERLGWEEREKAVKDYYFLAGVLPAISFVYRHGNSSTAEQMVRELLNGISRKEINAFCKNENLNFPKELLLLARE